MSKRVGFEHSEFGTGIGETQVRYHAPHTWRYVDLVAIENGSLWVSAADWDGEAAKWEQLAGCVFFFENAYQLTSSPP